MSHEDKWGNCEPLVIQDSKILKRIESIALEDYKYEVFATFIPYFDWLHSSKNQFYFISKNDPNKQPKESLTYQSWSGT